MMNWIANTIITTYLQKVDAPTNRRLIDTIVASVNVWLNGLAASQYILTGRLEFRESDNPTTDLMDGILRFRLFVCPPSPARDIEFIMEYDVNGQSVLFE